MSDSPVPAMRKWRSCKASSPKSVRFVKEIGVEEKGIVPIEVRTDKACRKIAEENHDIIERLARVSDVRFVGQIAAGLSKTFHTPYSMSP